MDTSDGLQQQFGERVRDLRKKKGLSQEAFSFECDLDRTYVSQVEQGRRNISLRNIKAMADALGISVAELFSAGAVPLGNMAAWEPTYRMKDDFSINRGFEVSGDDVRLSAINAAKQLRLLPFSLYQSIDLKTLWKWLIHKATQKDIQALPDLQPGERSTEFLHIIHAATKMAFAFKRIKVTPVLARNWEISRRVFAKHLHEIKHWEIVCGDYTEAPDIEATWFIDPPYRGDPGMGYRHSSAKINYPVLAEWVLSRRGDIICCEGDGANHLPFRHLLDLKGVAGKTSREMIFYRPGKTAPQKELFEDLAQQVARPNDDERGQVAVSSRAA
jgi:transcriptional regulator with XRE-family HTH domain